MPSLKNIRQRITAVKGISQVTRAMKMVAAARLKKSQENMEKARPYAFRIYEVLNHLLPDIDRSLNRLLEVRPVKNIGVVIITADRGLCGGFNSNIINRAHTVLNQYERDRLMLICIGKKGSDYFKKRGWNVIRDYTGFWGELDFYHAISIVDQIRSLYVDQNMDQVMVIFNEFKNVLQQNVVHTRFLPLVLEENGDEEDFEVSSLESTFIDSDYLFEPSMEVVVNSLVRRHLNVQMWRYLLESNAAEQAARMTSMDNATENALEKITELTLELNKARQAAITKEILEVISGAEALQLKSSNHPSGRIFSYY